MTTRPAQGDVYHAPTCPGLHGNPAKPRYVVVIHPNDKPLVNERVLVIPTSSSSISKFLVPMPTRETHKGCATGLPRRCDAVCDQPKWIPFRELDERVGRVSLAMLNQIMLMHEKALKPRVDKPRKPPKW